MSLLSPQLEAFMAVVKHRTVHGASSEIHITQTAVTQRIRSLEKSLKTTLFIRSRKGMQLTTEGKALLRYCMASRDLEGEALSIIQGAATEREVRLRTSGATSIMRSRIIPGCIEIMHKMPNLLMQYIVEDSNRHDAKLKAAECDLAIIEHEQLAKEMRFKELQPEQYVLVACKKWQNRKILDVIQNERIIDFDPNDKVTINYLTAYNLLEHANLSRHFVNRTDDLALLVSSGLGYTTLTKEFAEPYVNSGDLIILNQKKATI